MSPKTFSLYFDDDDRANRFHNTIFTMLTKKGKNAIKMQALKIDIIDCDDDIISAWNQSIAN